MLTESQIKNIHNLDFQTKVEILHECAEALGLSTVESYSKILCVPKRTVYENIKKGNIQAFVIDNHVFPYINQ